jgi:hypothetical protein
MPPASILLIVYLAINFMLALYDQWPDKHPKEVQAKFSLPRFLMFSLFGLILLIYFYIINPAIITRLIQWRKRKKREAMGSIIR